MILLFVADCLRARLQQEQACCAVDLDELADEENLGNLHNTLIEASGENQAHESADVVAETTAVFCAFGATGNAIVTLIIVLF